MDRKGDNIGASSSFLMGNLVESVVDNDVDLNDPIINFLVKNHGCGYADESDCESDDSDIGFLIEEHILLEKIKQVTGTKKVESDPNQVGSKSELDKESVIPQVSKTIKELKLFKAKCGEAMQSNWRMREELLSMEKKLVQNYRDACEKKQAQLKQGSDTKLKVLPFGSSDRFLDKFRSPYFKWNGSVAPLNQDSEKIATTNLPLISNNREWTSGNLASLCGAVRKHVIHCVRKQNQSDLLKKTDELFHLKRISLYDLVKDIDDDRLDWKIITESVCRLASEKECRQLWTVLLKPSLKEWDANEKLKLTQIAKTNNLQNWDKISLELNTGRTGYVCFSQHQSSFFMVYNDGKWSKEEEAHLSNVIENSKIGDCISWDKVTYCLDTKYVEQIYSKWHSFQAPHILRGSFSEREDRILLGLIHKFGADIKTVAAVLKNRSMPQLNAHYKDHLLPQLRLKIGAWTVKEDEKLLKLVEEHGETKWSTIAKHFETRSRVQIRHRYNLLKQKLAKNPNLKLSTLNRPKRTTSKKRVYKNKMFYNKVISTRGKHIKTLMQGAEIKPNKRAKVVDLKLTQYYQMKFLTRNVDEKKLIKSCQGTASKIESGSSKQNQSKDNGETEVNDTKSLVVSLLASSTALRNFHEAVETDQWSEKDRTAFYKGILDLTTSNKHLQDNLLKWHQVFCSLFSAAALLSHLNLKEWE